MSEFIDKLEETDDIKELIELKKDYAETGLSNKEIYEYLMKAVHTALWETNYDDNDMFILKLSGNEEGGVNVDVKYEWEE